MADAGDVQAIDVKFSEAIEFLRRRLNLSVAEFRALWEEAGGLASAVSDDQSASFVKDLLKAALDAVENGTTLEEFRARYAQIVEDAGWSYHGKAGWHSQLVFRLHTGTAYAAGRWQQAEELQRARPATRYYWRYVTVGDHRVRPHHREWQGIILPIDHPFWQTHYPPNGFNCRCHVQLITDRDIARHGWTVTADDDPRLSIPPDTGWAVNVGVVGARLAAVRTAAATA